MIILLKNILEKDIIEEETNGEKTNPDTNDVVGTGVASRLIEDSLKRVKCAQISIEVWPDKNKVAKGRKAFYVILPVFVVSSL